MDYNEYSILDDKELLEQLDKVVIADQFLKSREGRLLQEAANRIVERAVDQFAMLKDPSDLKEVIRLQTIIRKYKYKLFEEINMLKQEGEFALQELNERGPETIQQASGVHPVKGE